VHIYVDMFNKAETQPHSTTVKRVGAQLHAQVDATILSVARQRSIATMKLRSPSP
jgi:hypothetical protein